MSKRYAIWDKKTDICTPSGKMFTPEEWIEEYGWIKLPGAVPVISQGMINGAYSGELSQMRQMYENSGADFSDCLTDQEVLDRIEEFEDQMSSVEPGPTTEERTAAALEFIAASNLPDVQE